MSSDPSPEQPQKLTRYEERALRLVYAGEVRYLMRMGKLKARYVGITETMAENLRKRGLIMHGRPGRASVPVELTKRGVEALDAF